MGPDISRVHLSGWGQVCVNNQNEAVEQKESCEDGEQVMGRYLIVTSPQNNINSRVELHDIPCAVTERDDDDDVLTLDSLGLVHCSGTWMLSVLASSQTPSCMGSLRATSSMESTNGQDTSP